MYSFKTRHQLDFRYCSLFFILALASFHVVVVLCLYEQLTEVEIGCDVSNYVVFSIPIFPCSEISWKLVTD